MPKIFQYLVGSTDSVESYFASKQIIRDNSLILFYDAANQYYVFADPQEYREWYDGHTGEKCFHEVISGNQPQRIKFDVDAPVAALVAALATTSAATSTTAPKDIINEVMVTLIDLIMNELTESYKDIYPSYEDLVVTESHGAEKFSFHIITDPYYVKNNEEANEFTHRVIQKLPEEYRKFVDAGVNKKNQNFRMLGSAKHSSGRFKRICTDFNGTRHEQRHPADLLITLPPPHRKILAEICAEKPNKNSYIHVGELSQETIQTILLIARASVEGHTFDKTIGGSCLRFKRDIPTYCKLCHETHHKDNSLMLTMSTSGYIYEHCLQKPKESIFVGRLDGFDDGVAGADDVSSVADGAVSDTAANKMSYLEKRIMAINSQSVDVHKSMETKFEHIADKNVYAEPSMREYELVPTLVVKAQMKLGKTKGLKNFINKHFAADKLDSKCVRFVTFRQTFSASILKDFPDFSLYSNIDGDITQSKVPRLIVQVESLHRCIVGRQPDPVDLLILDEVESILAQFNSGLHKQFNAAFAVFQWMVKTAKHVICMDANISDRTYEVLARFRAQPMFFHWNKFERASVDTYKFSMTPSHWLGNLHAALLKGKRIVVPINSLSEAKVIKEMFSKEFPDKKIMLYSSETTASVKNAHFSDVHKYWSELDVLIYTPTCSAGVSFELEHFDALYGYFTDTSCDVETCRQMLGRVRAVKDYNIFFRASGANLPDTTAEIRRQLYNKRANLYRDAPIQFEYEEDGAIKFYESNYFYLWLENIRMINLSKNKFVSRFVDQVADSGASIEFMRSEANPDTLSGLLARHNTTKLDIIDKQNESIAQAVNLSVEEAHEIQDAMQNQKDITPDERCAFEKHKLREYYAIPDDHTVDAKFVEHFNNAKAKLVFQNLTKISQCSTVEESLALIKTKERKGYDAGMKLKDDGVADYVCESKDLLKERYIYTFRTHELSMWLLNICGFSSISDIRKIPITVVEDTMRQNLTKFISSFSTLAFEFEISTPKPDKILLETGPKFISAMLRIINKIIRKMYGRNIRPTKANIVHYHILKDAIGALFETEWNEHCVAIPTLGNLSGVVVVVQQPGAQPPQPGVQQPHALCDLDISAVLCDPDSSIDPDRSDLGDDYDSDLDYW